jgi:hypothetical protein
MSTSYSLNLFEKDIKMKVKIPDPFIIYASQFTLESILMSVAIVAFDIYKNPDYTFYSFAGYREYTVTLNKKLIHDRVLIVQTWIIDLMYELSLINPKGEKNINKDETLYLIHLYSNYVNKKDGVRFNNKIYSNTDFHLHLYGFFGEQKRFEEQYKFLEEFSREKYILEIVSSKPKMKEKFGISFVDEFLSITGYTTDMYSAMLFVIFEYVSQFSPIIYADRIDECFGLIDFDLGKILNLLEHYSCSIDELSTSVFKRQLLYQKPFIKYKNIFISSNPFLVISLFINSNYWIIREKYKNSDTDNQRFINAFGKYFEGYFEELLENCLPQGTFDRIGECDKKRADWHIKLSSYDFLVEQKSGLSILNIKQNEPNIVSMKQHIVKNWGKAVRQLDETEKSLGLKNAIKIILVYEDYYKSESLELLFEIDPDLKSLNNRKFWLLTINELEMLLYLYENDTQLFYEIIKEKDNLETSLSTEGRDMEIIMKKHKINRNKYLEDYGINNQFDRIVKLIKSKDSCSNLFKYRTMN